MQTRRKAAAVACALLLPLTGCSTDQEEDATMSVTRVVAQRTGGLAGGTQRRVYDRTMSYPDGAPEPALAEAAERLADERPGEAPAPGGDRYVYAVRVTWEDGTTDVYHAIDGRPASEAMQEVIRVAF